MEFPAMPANFDGFRVSPNPFDTSSFKELTLKNHSKFAVLFKVKCTSNKRVKIEDCADILRPGNETTVPITKLVDNVDSDALYVTYTLVGASWHDERMSVYRCWDRAKAQAVATSCITVRFAKKERKKEGKKEEKDKEKSRSEDEE